MNHRTDGQTRDCKGCRYWSEMIAHSTIGGVAALCLGPAGQAPRGHFRLGGQTCAQWASGHLGAVDAPGQDPDAYAEDAAPPATHS